MSDPMWHISAVGLHGPKLLKPFLEAFVMEVFKKELEQLPVYKQKNRRYWVQMLLVIFMREQKVPKQ